VIDLALDRHESRMLRVTDQSHWLARSAQPSLNLRTDGNPVHITAQHLCQKIVPIVAPIITDLFTEQTAADT
jgi:hypothetical protein